MMVEHANDDLPYIAEFSLHLRQVVRIRDRKLTQTQVQFGVEGDGDAADRRVQNIVSTEQGGVCHGRPRGQRRRRG